MMPLKEQEKEITVKVYNDPLEDEWDRFIDSNTRNATFLHSRRFFNHNILNSKDDSSLLFYKKGKIKAVLPACLREIDGQLIFHSHPRSTYGGFVVDESIGVKDAIEIVQETIDFAKSKKVNEIIIRNPFRIFHQLPSDETDYAMWYHGFSLKSRELECAIRLNSKTESRYKDGTKDSIKKALATVTVKESNEYERFWQLLNGNISDKFGKKPTHTLEQFLLLKSLVSDDKIKLMGGYINDVFVCGMVLFICKPSVLHAQYIASDIEYQNSRPSNGLIDHIIKWGIQEGFDYLNLSMANEEAGRVINYGLFRFKEGFGGRGVLRETMHLELNY
jgi:hypothetical protein